MEVVSEAINGLNDVKREIIISENKSSLMPVNIIKERMIQVNELYKDVLQVDQHYGKIPGTKKDTLLKPGAEKINIMFQLVNKIDKENIIDFDNNHREYRITLGLYHKKTNELWGQGIGSCSTLESKFRYRYDEGKEIGPVTKEYWDCKNNNNLSAFYKKNPNLRNARTKKTDNGWKFLEKGEKIENPDIADIYNTVYKMAYKRALVSATIASTGVSDIFTQDVEDMQTEQKKDNYDALLSFTIIMGLVSQFKGAFDQKQQNYFKSVYQNGYSQYLEANYNFDIMYFKDLISKNSGQ